MRNCASHMLLLMFNSSNHGLGPLPLSRTRSSSAFLTCALLINLHVYVQFTGVDRFNFCSRSLHTCNKPYGQMPLAGFPFLHCRTRVVSSSWPLTEDFWPTPANLVEKGMRCHTIPSNPIIKKVGQDEKRLSCSFIFCTFDSVFSPSYSEVFRSKGCGDLHVGSQFWDACSNRVHQEPYLSFNVCISIEFIVP